MRMPVMKSVGVFVQQSNDNANVLYSLMLHQANAPTLTWCIFCKHTPKLIIFDTL